NAELSEHHSDRRERLSEISRVDHRNDKDGRRKNTNSSSNLEECIGLEVGLHGFERACDSIEDLCDLSEETAALTTEKSRDIIKELLEDEEHPREKTGVKHVKKRVEIEVFEETNNSLSKVEQPIDDWRILLENPADEISVSKNVPDLIERITNGEENSNNSIALVKESSNEVSSSEDVPDLIDCRSEILSCLDGIVKELHKTAESLLKVLERAKVHVEREPIARNHVD